jgi:hypothetical protein
MKNNINLIRRYGIGSTVTALYIGKENTICTRDSLSPSESANYVLVKIKKHEVFMIGDNYCNSLDSRSYGPVDKSQICGIYLRTKNK